MLIVVQEDNIIKISCIKKIEQYAEVRKSPLEPTQL